MNAATQAPRMLIRSYGDLHAALRARAEELKVSRATIDAVAGFPERFASKALGPHPRRHLSLSTVFDALGALGLALVIVEDAEALERVRGRLVPRCESNVRAKHGAMR